VEDVLDAREWDQYKDMIDELRGLIKEPDARTPGSAPFKRILQLHTAISKVAKIKARHPGAAAATAAAAAAAAAAWHSRLRLTICSPRSGPEQSSSWSWHRCSQCMRCW
jgi:hypothetical protein